MPVIHKEKSKKVLEKDPAESSCSFFQGDTELGKKLHDFLNGPTYAIVSTLILLYTLFADDIRQIWFPVTADLTFTILTLICMIYYMIEIIIFSLVQKDYFLGYYFWLDLISTLTMAFDLVWITQFLTGGGKNAANISQISRASRAARLGTRTVKLIRLIRMVKILKQMKALSQDMAQKQKENKPKKPAQRLSSQIASLRHMEKINSARNFERLPSKRWSVLKDVACMGVEPAPHTIPLNSNIITIAAQTFKNQDQINQSEASSRKSVSIRKMEEEEKHSDVHKYQEGAKKNVIIPIFEDTRQEAKGELQEEKEEKKDDNPMLKSKKTRQEIKYKKNEDEGKQNGTEQEIVIPPESKVGAKVQEEVQKNVISMIILILLSIPLLDASTWYSPVTIYEQAQQGLLFYAQRYPSKYQQIANLFIQEANSKFLNPLLYFNINTGSISDSFPDNYVRYAGTVNQILTNTRSDDINIVEADGYTFGYDISAYNKAVSYFNLGRTFFVCILLIITTMFFSSDLQFTAIAPLEDMMETVRKIAVHPLNGIRQIQQKNMCLQKIEEEQQKTQITQPKILQNAIVKISSLLAIGFGQAGTQIICKVIEDPTVIDVMIPGQKIMAIFGFCDIRNFTDATEVLEADVMVFVNQIAALCHKEVYEHLGSPNKNIGDAFLLVWKFSQEDIKVIEKQEEVELELIPSNRVHQMADLAVLALINMVASIGRSETLQKYKQNKGLQGRIPNYSNTGVKMGFGLHVGWSIEGPIGSEYKIDASYLGPDVHMASRLEGATKAYGTGMLITGEVHDLMTQNKKNLRLIDHVMSEGDNKVVDLYTADINPIHLFSELGVNKLKKMSEREKRLAKVYQSIQRKNLAESIDNDGSTKDLWNNEEIKIMQEVFTPQFYEQWKVGFDLYVNGDWENALPQLTLASNLGPGGKDGPSQSLITFIEENKGRAPANWKGYRTFD